MAFAARSYNTTSELRKANQIEGKVSTRAWDDYVVSWITFGESKIRYTFSWVTYVAVPVLSWGWFLFVCGVGLRDMGIHPNQLQQLSGNDQVPRDMIQ